MTELFALENNEAGPLLENIHEETQAVISDKKANLFVLIFSST